MSIWAIVPAKPLRESKSRLASVLTPSERENLSRTFLIDTLENLKLAREIKRTLVVSRDPAALRLARERGAFTVAESGAPELNSALTRATDVAAHLGAHAVLILPSDLPMLQPMELRALIASCGERDCVAIAPDWRRQGTNALFVRPPRRVPFAFGPGSFERHVALAHDQSVPVEICDLPGFGMDIDLPEDLEMFRAKLHDWKGA